LLKRDDFSDYGAFWHFFERKRRAGLAGCRAAAPFVAARREGRFVSPRLRRVARFFAGNLMPP